VIKGVSRDAPWNSSAFVMQHDGVRPRPVAAAVCSCVMLLLLLLLLLLPCA